MASTLDRIIGVAMIVLGALVLLGELGVGFLLPILGVALIVLGILMLLDVLSGSTFTGVLVIVLGLLLYLGFVDVPDLVTRSINIIVGVVLVILGILQAT